MPTIVTRGAASARGFGFAGKIVPPVTGQQAYTTAGTYTWVAPTGVTSVSVVAVGGGGAWDYSGCARNAGGGGGLGYKNNISVTPGASYTVVAGARGTAANNCGRGGDSYFCSTTVVKGGRGGKRCGGSYTGTGGGNGGFGAYGGGCNELGGAGGAGGYSGAGGFGANAAGNNAGYAGAGGGGGGGGARSNGCAGSGGGVGLLGSGANGAGGAAGGGGGGGGSGGANGAAYCVVAGSGGAYGGGGRCNGAVGAVRIIWPGNTRSFPSTCTGDK